MKIKNRGLYKTKSGVEVWLYMFHFTGKTALGRLEDGNSNSFEWNVEDGTFCGNDHSLDIIERLNEELIGNVNNMTEFKIDELGLYKTRDGKQVYISFINIENNRAIGIRRGEADWRGWNLNGQYYSFKDTGLDVVSKWKE